jgi:NADPH:quinone reductase-like Zn-dependent oxidoreductase
MPDNLSFAEASVIPISAGAALQALTDVGKVQAGQSVLVTGASGGVGSYAVQLAVSMGAEVTGVCSGAKVGHVAGLGAHRVLDHTRDDWADGARRYDLILDIAGNPPLRELRRGLRPRGTAVFVGGEGNGALIGMGRQLGGTLLSTMLEQRLVVLMARERAAYYERLSHLVEAGHLTPVLDHTYPLERAAEAVRRLEDGGIRGKVSITI